MTGDYRHFTIGVNDYIIQRERDGVISIVQFDQNARIPLRT
jgi:hypothetical protein